MTEEVLVRTPWRICFATGCGLVVRRTTYANDDGDDDDDDT
jgi:hypothetical protein